MPPKSSMKKGRASLSATEDGSSSAKEESIGAATFSNKFTALKTDLDFTSILKAGIFTFFIGEERERLNVHISALQSISEPLGVMMTNGKMEESIKQEAVLSDVDPTTFGMLVEYAYKGLCGIMKGSSTASQASSAPNLSTTILPVTFKCHTRCASINKGSAPLNHYPFCSLGCRKGYSEMLALVQPCQSLVTFGFYCHDKNHPSLLYCVADGTGLPNQDSVYNKLLCTNCQRSQRAKNYPPYTAEPYSETHEMTKCSPAFSSKKYGCSELSHEELRGLAEKHSAKDNKAKPVNTPILQLAKLYALATKYMVVDLPDICLHKLHRQLLTFNISKDSINELVELILYTYENTSDEGSIVDNTGDKLRDLMIRYAVDRAKDAMQYEEFRYQGMLGAGGAPSADFMAVTYGKTAS